MIARPCLGCGEPTPATRCSECAADHRPPVRASFRQRGYGTAWTKLSERARRLQPFCNRCGSTARLTCHHTEQAWQRHNAGLPIRLVDVEVLCNDCNVAAGSTRPRGETPGRQPSVPPGKARDRLHTLGGYPDGRGDHR